MNYADGQRAQVGDVVGLGNDRAGLVVCVISDGVYSANYPEAAWSYLKRGFLVDFPKYGLIHYEDAEAELELIFRARARK